MPARNVFFSFFLILLFACQAEEQPSISKAGSATSLNPGDPFDGRPIVFDLELPAIDEDTVTAPIFLSYADPEGGPGTSCEISERNYLTIASPCECYFGLCVVELKPSENFYGPISFSYSVTVNGQASSQATASFYVRPVNDQPLAFPYAFTTNQNTSYVTNGTSFFPHLFGSDPDGDTFSCVLENGPDFGILILNPDCSFTYTPDLNYTGEDSFYYRTDDGVLSSDPTLVEIDVVPVTP